MQLNKLIAMRDGHRRLISRELERFDSTELTTSEYERLLHMIVEEAGKVRTLNDKIVNHNDIEDLSSELVEGKSYSFDLELKIQRLKDNLNKRIGNKKEITSNVSQDENNSGQPEPDKEIVCALDEIQPGLPELNRHTLEVSTTKKMTNQSVSFQKLPKLSLPSFHGDIVEWQTFWDSFECSVHQNQALSDVQNFAYLRALVHGAASSCIAGFQLTNVNYMKAIELLKQRFGQPEKIVEALMQSLIQLDPPKNTPDSLQAFYDRLETSIRGLESLEECQETYGNLLVPIIRDKLPTAVRQSMARDHGTNRWMLPDLRCAIEKEIAIMREGDTRELLVYVAHMPTASFHTGSRCLRKKLMPSRSNEDIKHLKVTCHFCDGEHFATNCNKRTNDRVQIVKQKKMCFNCLSNSHQVALCKSHNRCRNCQRKHHTAICEQRNTRSSLNPDASPFQGSATAHTILHSSTQARSNVLLKTAVGKVSSDNCMIEANILFDKGAQRSFITEKLANELNVKETGTETIYLAAFGHSSQNVQIMKTATVHVITDWKERIPIDVLITSTIAAPLQNLQKNITSLSYLRVRGLKLAHPVTGHETFDIAMLIGADAYWKIVQNHVVRGNGPTAVQSKLGYLLSGPLPNTSEGTMHHMLNIMTSLLNTDDIERFWKLESIGITPEAEVTCGPKEL
ncbi:uncharacterized protein LOC127835952 [Dreissena polymorpha]|uniref:uncharacterized protein LOC127835952 n=1 Tax=Dreissena polymorpha TaxID=45954 RepID=UPI00226569D4|nr:uncharacterized protein LOC127835952 [Dreissena polymorpha]